MSEAAVLERAASLFYQVYAVPAALVTISAPE
jgi:hypothetical protein